MDTVKPIEKYLPDFKDKHRIILTAIEQRTDLTIQQRLELYEQEKTKLENEFRAIRKPEYEAVTSTVTQRHSCTDNAPGTKDCKWKWAVTPNDLMFTKEDWVVFSGKYNDSAVYSNKAGVRIKTASGTKRAKIVATFRYKPDAIETLVEADVITLFRLILQHNMSLTENIFSYDDE